MRIASGVTDQYIYFVAVDATDFSTRETGLSSFTVYRSRNGGVAAAMTTPTINETDTTNMPGVYELLLDEDMTIDSGDETQEMVFHITHAGMAPVTRTIELYRPKITAGNTLDVTATGAAGVDWGNVENQSTSVNLSATTTNLCNTITTYTGNTVQTGDAFARLGAPAGASVSADIATIDSNVDAILLDTAEIGAAGAGLTAIPWNASWDAEVQSEVNDGLVAFWTSPATLVDLVWDEVLTGATHNVAASAGRRLRSVQDNQAYDDGAIWVDTVNGTAGTTVYENGTAGLPVSTLADALTLAAAANVKHLHIVNGSTITFTSSMDNYELTGDEWGLALGGQSCNSLSINSAHLNGVGVTGTFSGNPHILHSTLGAITGPNARIGWSALTGIVTSNGTGTWVIHSCWGLSGAQFDFGAGGAQVVYITDWVGGPITIANMSTGDILYFEGRSAVLTLAASCTGGTVFLAGDIALTNSGSGQTINQTSRYEITRILSDSTAFQGADIAAILADTNELQTDDVPGLIAALNDLSAAQVNAEVVDALATDTYAEPGQGIPGATISLAAKINYLYKSWRNKKDNDGSTTNLYADNGTTVDQKQTTSEAAGTVTKDEWVSGP